LILVCVVLFLLASTVTGQGTPSDGERLRAAQKALDIERWQEAAAFASGPIEQSLELDLIAGIALARLNQLDEARKYFEAGREKAPKDSRFVVELAGVAYKQKDFRSAKRELHSALLLNPGDAYAREFLGTIYFIEGNLEATLKWWNSVEKPRLGQVHVSPLPKLRESLRDRAVDFNAPQVLTADSLLAAQARLQNLGIFPQQRIELAPAAAENYDATLHLAERNGWGDSKLEGAIALLGGLPYSTIYPEYYNLGHRAVNFTSLARWDSEKRRVSGALSMPLWDDPALGLRVYFDARNENWNLSQAFFSPDAPLTDLNLRSAAVGSEFRAVVNGRWNWSTGLEFKHRTFRNLESHTSAAELPFFTDGAGISGWLQAERSLLRIPEHRFVLDSTAQVRTGRNFASGTGAYGALNGALQATWFPHAMGDDYEMQARIRAGDTAGKVPLDELFQLGVDRDNDLWLRGHSGTIGGRKGAAPLGRRFFLANWELDKNVYQAGFLNVKLGPFVDSGDIADSSGLFGSQRWLWDTGIQCKIRVLGSVTVVLSYGRDLRGGKGVFYGTTLR